MRIVADTYAWVEIFIGSAKGEIAKRAIEEADLLLTPEIVLAEIARKYVREGLDDTTTSKRLAAIAESSELSHIDLDIALMSAKTYTELESRSKEARVAKPSLFDAIMLATARTNNAKVLTGDQHFKGLPDTFWLGD